MLAPGEYLTCPTTPEQNRAPIQIDLETVSPPQQPTAIPAAIEEQANRSFLLTLLRVLGAVHT
jgi:hypothetical protein